VNASATTFGNFIVKTAQSKDRSFLAISFKASKTWQGNGKTGWCPNTEMNPAASVLLVTLFDLYLVIKSRHFSNLPESRVRRNESELTVSKGFRNEEIKL
jgi:hypothetical protein